MKHTLKTELKFNKLTERLYKLKVQLLNTQYWSLANECEERAIALFDIYKNNKLTDKERTIISEIKKEKVAERVRKLYKKKLNKVQRQLDNTISPKERSKIGYLKYKARQRLNRPSPKIVAESMVKFSKVDIQE